MDVSLERILSLLPQKDGKPVFGSKTALARELGLPSNIFAEWVAGRNKSYEKYLYQIAEKYDVSVDWLKGLTDERTPKQTVNTQNNVFMERFERLSPTDQTLILALMDSLLEKM